MTGNKCASNLPYPKIQCKEKNDSICKMLFPLYGGKYGEFTATSQYIYQHIVLTSSNSYISDILECIAITEMKHFDILAKLIIVLGGDPKIGDIERNRQYYWSSSNVSYSKRIDKIISDNIVSEKRAVSDYTAFLKKCNDDLVNEVIKRIIKDEEKHIQILLELFSQFT